GCGGDRAGGRGGLLRQGHRYAAPDRASTGGLRVPRCRSFRSPGWRFVAASCSRVTCGASSRARPLPPPTLSTPRCEERQSPDICFFAESFIRMAAPEQLACDDVLGTVFDSQLEASLNPVGATGEIAVTRAAHCP